MSTTAPGSPVFTAHYALGEEVLLGRDDSIRATVVAVTFRPGGVEYEVAWMNQGALHTAEVSPFMLRPADRRGSGLVRDFATGSIRGSAVSYI